MSLTQIFKKILIPCAAGVSQVDSQNHTYGPNCTKRQEEETGMKPSDLPIYNRECLVCRNTPKAEPPPSSFEETVGNIRRELWVWQDNLKGYRHKIIDVYRRGFSQADSAIDFLREPANATPRMGAIAISGLTGYILGMRGGKMRRMLYGTIGAMSMAAVCYPEEAKDYLETAVLEGRRVFIVAYHFIYGETPQIPDWLEKFVGPIGQKEVEAQTIDNTSKKAILNEETKPTKEKKP